MGGVCLGMMALSRYTGSVSGLKGQSLCGMSIIV